jgi:CBS domain-containing protein
VANRDVPTCAPSDHVGDIRRRLNESGADACAVLGRSGVVLGLARSRDVQGHADVTVEEVMNPGPVTYRPDTILAELVEHLLQSRPKPNHALVTTSDGRLVGMLHTADAERILEEIHARHAHHDHHAA